MKRIALIAFFYPPSRSSGTYRPLAIANHLAKRGHEVTVFITSKEFFKYEAGPPDLSLLKAVREDVNVVRVPFSRTPASNDLRLMNPTVYRFRKLFSRLGPAGRKLTAKFMLKNGGMIFPGALQCRYRSWYAPCLAALVREHQRSDFDLVFATGNPWTAFAVARDFSSISSIPFVMDYRDPWKYDVTSFQPIPRTAREDRYEIRLLEEASFVTFPNAAIRERYVANLAFLSAKSEVLENGFDHDTLPRLKSMSEGTNCRIRFGSLGTVSHMWPLEEFGSAWVEYSQQHPDASFDLAGHLGWFDDGDGALSHKLTAFGSNANYVGPLQRDAVAKYYESLDVIVGFFWGGPSLTAGKMYEIAATGLPILCIQPQGGGVRTFLERNHPYAVCVDPQPSLILEGLRRTTDICMNLDLDDKIRCREMMARFSRESLIDKVLGRIDA